METSKNLQSIYSKRMTMLETIWSGLISEQKKMTRAQIVSEDFQSKKKRVGAIYNRMNKIINQPKTDAINTLLKSVAPTNFSNVPKGLTSINFKTL